MNELLQRELEPQVSPKLEIFNTVVVNPNRRGKAPMDVALTKRISNDSVIMAVIDVDDQIRNPPSEDALRIEKNLLKASEQFAVTPKLQQGYETIINGLEDAENYSSVAMVVFDEERGRNIILTGTNGVGSVLTALDSRTHEIVKPKKANRNKDDLKAGGITFQEYYLHENRIYMVLGKGFDVLDRDTKQRIIHNSLKEKKSTNSQIELSDVITPLARAAKRKMNVKDKTGLNRQVTKNDLSVAAFLNPKKEIKPPVTEVKQVEEKKQNFISRFIKRLLVGDLTRQLVGDLQMSSDVNKLAEHLKSKLPESERQAVLSSLKVMLAQPGDADKSSIESVKMLNSLLSNIDSTDQTRALEYQGIEVKDIRELMNKGAMWDMMSVMLDHREKFLSVLSVVLAEVPMVDIPTEVREKLGNIPKMFDMELKSSHGVWYLCSMYADRLKRSMKRDGMIFVNDIPVKFLGKPAGLVLDDMGDGDDTLLKGTIVSFTNNEQRAKIKQAFDDGETSIYIENPELAVMRQWIPKLDGMKLPQIIKKIAEYKKNLPDKFDDKIGKISRAKWRIKNAE